MILTTIKRIADLDRGVQKEPLHAAFVMGDQEAHRFAVKLVRPSRKESVSLSAAGVQGYFMRADGSTVVVDGEGEGDTAIVILPAACYAVPGRFTLIIRVSMGDTIHSVMIADGVVSRSRTDVLIDPGDAIPSLDALLSQIASLEAATKAAQEIVMRDEEAAGSASAHAASAAASAGTAMNAAAEAKTSAQSAGSSEQSAKAADTRAASSASSAETSALRAEAAANRAENAEITDSVIAKAVNDYLSKNPVESVAVDTTLSKAGKAADAATVGKKIGDLSMEIDDISNGLFVEEVITGKNLLNPETVVPGYLNNNVLTAHADWVTCDYIYVGDLSNIVCSIKETGHTASMFFFNKYDARKNFISSVSQQQYSYAVEDGVAYVRFAIKTDRDPATIQVESGTTITSFEPYMERVAKVPKKVWTEKKWVVIGDSLTEENGRTTMNYHHYIAQSTGITVVNMGRSGTGYANGASNSDAFYQRISAVPTDADVVTIFGSGNDMSSGLALGEPTDTGTETICGCINTTIDNLIAIIPAVSLGIVSPTPWVGSPPYNKDSGMAKYCAAMKTICENRSIPFLDLYHCSNLRPWTEEGRAVCYTKDDGNGVHPDETGHALIAPRFRAFLETLIL